MYCRVTFTDAGLGDAADVVAAEVEQLQVLGALLLVGQQFGGQRLVLRWRGAALARAGDRPQRVDVVARLRGAPGSPARRRRHGSPRSRSRTCRARGSACAAPGRAPAGLLRRACSCAGESTTCMMSPSVMYCLALITAALKASSPNSDSAGALATTVSSGSATGARSLASSSFSRACACFHAPGKPGSAKTTSVSLPERLSTMAISSESISRMSGVPSVIGLPGRRPASVRCSAPCRSRSSRPGRRRSAAGPAGPAP